MKSPILKKKDLLKSLKVNKIEIMLSIRYLKICL